MSKITSNEELNKSIKECKTPQDLHNLQQLFANEIIGRITDAQALKILKAEEKMRMEESKCKKTK